MNNLEKISIFIMSLLMITFLSSLTILILSVIGYLIDEQPFVLATLITVIVSALVTYGFIDGSKKINKENDER